MTPPTHMAFSGFLWLFLSAVMSIPLNLLWLGAGCLFSLLPDIDSQNSRVGRIFFFLSKRIEKRFGHRSITHSLLGIVILGLVLFPLRFISPTLFGACLVGYSSHVFLDSFNKTGVQLFYPDGIQAVMPGREEYRFVYGGKGEMVLLFVFLGVGTMLFPIANKGLMKFIHYMRGDPEAAVTDFRDYAQDHIVWCDLKGLDVLTNKPVEGRFKVVGAAGSTTLIISNHGNLRTAGNADAVNIRALKTRCVKGEEISIVVAEAHIKDRYMGEIKNYIDTSKEHYLFSVLDVEEKPVLEEKVDWFKTVYYLNNKLHLDYARWSDIEKLNIEWVLVKEGHVLVKTILKKNESMDVEECDGREPKEEGRMIMARISVEDPMDVLVKGGTEIRVGEPFARMSASDGRKLEELKGELDYQERLIDKGIGSNKCRNEVLEKINRIEEEYRSSKVSKFNGRVNNVEVKGVKDGVVSVEVALEVPLEAKN